MNIIYGFFESHTVASNLSFPTTSHPFVLSLSSFEKCDFLEFFGQFYFSQFICLLLILLLGFWWLKSLLCLRLSSLAAASSYVTQSACVFPMVVYTWSPSFLPFVVSLCHISSYLLFLAAEHLHFLHTFSFKCHFVLRITVSFYFCPPEVFPLLPH